MDNATIEITYDCPDCEGRGGFPGKAEQRGNTRHITPPHACSRCENVSGIPKGKLRKRVSLEELRDLLAAS